VSVLRSRLSVCVVGAGNGGVAMAGHLGLKGHRVRLYSRSEEKIAAVRRAGGIFLTGAVEGFGPVECATTELAVFHPAPLILNASKVDQGEPFDYYHEGITPSVAALMERVDAERLAVARALGVSAVSAKDWLAIAYGVRGETLYEAIQRNASYGGIKAPRTLMHRYILEDVPTGLIPIASFGRLAGVPTPFTESLIQMACGVTGIDFWRQGRTVESLGLAGMSPAEIREYVETGLRPARGAYAEPLPVFVPAEV